MTWTDANGAATVLDGSAGILLEADPVGLGAPAPTDTVDDYIAFDGGVLVNRRRGVRQLALKLYIEHATRVETIAAHLAAMLQGPGMLTWSDDVQTRSLRNVIYEAGIDGSGVGNLLERSFVVSLLALDPWWYGPPQSATLSTDAATSFAAAIPFDSVTPFDGGGSTAVSVVGDVDAWPVFTVTGPVSTLTVGSGGAAWQISSPLTSSDTLVVDHRPESRGPSKNSGPVDYSLLSEASRLFPLTRGLTAVISGATGQGVTTGLIMAYSGRYLTP